MATDFFFVGFPSTSFFFGGEVSTQAFTGAPRMPSHAPRRRHATAPPTAAVCTVPAEIGNTYAARLLDVRHPHRRPSSCMFLLFPSSFFVCSWLCLASRFSGGVLSIPFFSCFFFCFSISLRLILIHSSRIFLFRVFFFCVSFFVSIFL